ncbi:hypothetical protein ACRRTK_016175 [Alexandromys fortis]
MVGGHNMRNCIIKGRSIRKVEDHGARGRNSREPRSQNTRHLMLVVLSCPPDTVITCGFCTLHSDACLE